MKYITILVSVSALFGGGDADACVKAFTTPPVDDCTTSTSAMAADEIPCFVYTNGTTEALEFPQPNTRTCYRTCHTTTPPTCQATQKGPHNQNIPVTPAGTSTQQVIFSPNYNDPNDYRKSTICRYDVTCPAGMLLTYSFTGHILEDRASNCSTTDKCVDYVHVTFPNTLDEDITCGQEPALNSPFANGDVAFSVEFYANRHEQAAGFSMLVTCITPPPPPPPPGKKRRQTDGNGECSLVSNAVRPTVDGEAQLYEAIASENNESRAIIQADLQQGSGRRRLVINELENLRYTDGTLTITRRKGIDGRRRVAVARNISVLYVSSRFAKSTTIRGGCHTNFPGYAECYIREDRAYLLRLGINPLFKPTADELKVMARLNQAITKALECTYFFDVYDELDALEKNVTYQPSVCKNTFVEDPSVSELARRYGSACNVFLRSAACSYQTVILHRDCITGEPTTTCDLPTTLPTTKQALVTSDSPNTVANTITTTETQTSATSGSFTTVATSTTTTETQTSATSDSPTPVVTTTTTIKTQTSATSNLRIVVVTTTTTIKTQTSATTNLLTTVVTTTTTIEIRNSATSDSPTTETQTSATSATAASREKPTGYLPTPVPRDDD